VPLEVAAQCSDVAYAEQIVGGELVLKTEAELVDLGPLLASGDIRETCGPYGSRPDIPVTDDIINGQVRCCWGIAVEPCTRLKRVAAVPSERIAPADDGLAASNRVIGEAEAWRYCAVVRVVTASRNATVSALQQAVPIVQIISTRPRDDVSIRIPDPRVVSFDARREWGSIRACLNEKKGEVREAYRGNYLHGKVREGDYTHGCICERSEQILRRLLALNWREQYHVRVIVK